MRFESKSWSFVEFEVGVYPHDKRHVARAAQTSVRPALSHAIRFGPARPSDTRFQQLKLSWFLQGLPESQPKHSRLKAYFCRNLSAKSFSRSAKPRSMMALTLTERVHSLAPELFDKVYEAFIATNENEPVSINADYKFPVQLHVDRSTRHRFAAKYYRRPFKATISSFASATSPQDEEEYEDLNLRKWLGSLQANHHALVGRIEVEQADYRSFFGRPWAHQRLVKIVCFIHDRRYHMPELVVFAEWGVRSDKNAETVLVRLEGYRVGSWQSSLAARTRGAIFAWPWNDLGHASADIDETRLVVIDRPAQAVEQDT